MKVFKWIYYPVMIILVVIMTVFGFLGTASSEKAGLLPAASRERVDKHIQEIAGKGTHNAGFAGNMTEVADYIRVEVRRDNAVYYRATDNPDSEGMNSTTRFYTGTTGKEPPQPSYVAQNARLLPATVAKMEGGDIYVDRELTNLIVAIPGSDTIAKAADPDNEALSYGDAVLFSAHYDSSSLSGGAADSAVLANMIEVIRLIAGRSTPYKNDFVFLFAAGGEENAIGAYAFRYQFTGFNDISSRIKVAFDFDSAGADGALVMSKVSDCDPALASECASIAGKTYSGSIYSAAFADEETSAFDVFSDIPAARFTTATDQNYGTGFDTVDKVDADLVTAYGNMMYRAAEHFGDRALDSEAKGGAAGYFNYLGATVAYRDYVAYIAGALIIVLAALGIFFSWKNKTFGVVKMLLGAVVQLLAIAATLVAAYVAYLVIALILSASRVVNIHAIALATLSDPGITIFAIVLVFALSVAFYPALKKIFAIPAADVVRGNALIMALVAAVFCFAAPKLSYLFFPVAVLWMAILLVTSLVRNKFKAKFGMSIDRLFLYAIPTALMLPVLFGEMSLALTSAPLVMLPLFVTLLFAFAGSIMPFADYLHKPIDVLFEALPGVTVREKQTVTVMEEDAAKKGKFNEVQKTQVVKSKAKLSYHNAVGIAIVSIVSVVAICLFSVFAGGFGKNISSKYSFYDEVYKNALVYVWEDGNETLEVRDLDAYKYIARYIDGFEWDGERNAYVRVDNTGSMKVPVKPTVTEDNTDGKKFRVTILDSGDMVGGTVTLKLSGFTGGNIDKVTFTSASGSEWEYDLSERHADDYTFVLPFDYASDFTFAVEGTAQSFTVDVEQRGSNTQLANNHSLFSVLQEQYSTDEDVQGIRMSIVMRTVKTFEL